MLNKTGHILILDDDGKELEDYAIVAGSWITAADGEKIKKGTQLARWDRTTFRFFPTAKAL